MKITHLYLSPEHRFVGRFGQEPREAPIREVRRVHAVTGKGLEGDRYFARADGHKGQVTFFAEETWERLRRELAVDATPDVFRRNVIVRGADLRALIGQEFELQAVRFFGAEHCRPCCWMDRAFGAGTLERLAEWEAGGLRARILSDGWLHCESEVAS
ncbi:MAG TPA: MOSC domain-containing protein [Opitutaceae bacterium]|nr:MOSC domain-containing protein [Opitutaceae bacterium]